MMLLPIVMNADPVEINGIYYNLIAKGKVAEVTINPNKYSGDVVIPASITYDDVEYNVTRIDDEAFASCYELTSVTIGSNVTTLGNFAFSSSYNLVSVSFPDNITTIGKGAFSGCWKLTTINIPNSVKNIGANAFEFCGITSIVIPNNVTTIEEFTFYHCTQLTSVTIPESVVTIGKESFRECTGLQSIDIPNSVTDISKLAFYGCTGLTSFIIPNKVNCIYENTFDGCTGLTSVTFPTSLSVIKKKAFIGCTSLTSLDIPNIYAIEESAFKDCSSLITVSVGEQTNHIYSTAFANCTELSDFYCYANKVPSTSSDCFDGSFPEYIVLHVPTNSVDAYKTVDPWQKFKEIVAITSTKIEKYKLTYMVDNEVYKTDSLEYGAAITPEPDPIKKGYTFSGWSEIPETMPDYDVTITGSFSVNSYKLTYMVDNVEYKSFMIEYGAAITPEEAPEKEGYTFSGWSEIPETMPDYDVVVTGTFTQNKLEKCETPSISYDNGQLKMGCATEGVTFITEVKVADAKQYFDETIQLSCIYDISVYATKAGYDNSETVTATLCWIDAEPKTEGISNGVTEVRARAALIKSNGDQFTVEGIDDGQTVEIYSLNGEKRGSAIGKNGVACIDTNVRPGSIVVVKMGEKSVKVIVK